MNIELQANPDELMQKFAALESRTDVADILEVGEWFLCKILYGIEERKKYKTFEIRKKSSKKREISAPPKNISILQSKLNTIFKLIYEPKYCVHGFAENRSILTNAERHISKRHVINIDLKDFFPSIHLGRIKGALMSPPFNVGEKAATVIAQICSKDDGSLPQGGPTSPSLSNIICRSLDNDLMSFARKVKCHYTRYADDMTFSTSAYRLPKELAVLKNKEVIIGSKLNAIISKHKFTINPEKTRHTHPSLRQDVTGLTVNEFPNIRRSYIRSILGALYAWEKHGYDAAHRKYLSKYQPRHHSGLNLDNVLKGKIAFVKMVLGDNSPLFRKLAKKYNNLSKKCFDIKPILELDPYPLRGNQPKNQVWSKWFNKYKNSVLFMEIENDRGDPETATAFYIGNNVFATAGHNLKYKNAKLYFGESASAIEYSSEYDDKSIDVGIIKHENQEIRKLVWLPTQIRLPEIGEEIAAIGYPVLPQRYPALVMHIGVVEALPVAYKIQHKLIQVSFQSGGGLSGGCLIDRGGFVIGVMVENIYMQPEYDNVSNSSEEEDVIGQNGQVVGKKSGKVYNKIEAKIPIRPYGQAVPVEYLADKLHEFNLLSS